VNNRQLTGRISPDRIRLFEVPRLPAGTVEALNQLGDATGIISDVLDELGIVGVVGAGVLKPTIVGARVVGPALTVRNIMQRQHPYEGAKNHTNKMAEFEAHNLALPGDVLVIDGVPGVSNMGGLSAQTGKRQGEQGAIVFGGIRDIAHSRAVNYPVWSTDITPVTGKWRLETIEINGPVQIGDIQVHPGDLVIADDTGVCFVPRDRVAEVVSLAQQRSAKEDKKSATIDSGVSVAEVAKGT
jgi:regulator of RNase E activity RraA